MDLGNSSSNSICSSREYSWLIGMRVEYFLTIYSRTGKVDVSHPSLNQGSSGIYMHVHTKLSSLGPWPVIGLLSHYYHPPLKNVRRSMARNSARETRSCLQMWENSSSIIVLVSKSRAFSLQVSKDGDVEWKEKYLLQTNNLGGLK